MTQEHVTITEEVVKDGKLVTQERVTLQHTPDPHDDPVRAAAMSVTHPDFAGAEERVYTYNEATGMSESSVVELPDVELVVTDDGFTVTHEVIPSTQSDPALCLHPIGNGECQLPEGHSGSHKMNVD